MDDLSVNDYLKSHIRTVPDWPAPGVQFRDITPLLQDPRVFRVLIDAFVHRYMHPALRPDVVAGLDARGFILGSVVAYELGLGFVPIRKKGKLPFTTVEETYELEYGSATVELHTDAVKPGQRVLLIDDLIATGGTAVLRASLVWHSRVKYCWANSRNQRQGGSSSAVRSCMASVVKSAASLSACASFFS
jgi:adenine phosphoribosyltransferase